MLLTVLPLVLIFVQHTALSEHSLEHSPSTPQPHKGGPLCPYLTLSTLQLLGIGFGSCLFLSTCLTFDQWHRSVGRRLIFSSPSLYSLGGPSQCMGASRWTMGIS